MNFIANFILFLALKNFEGQFRFGQITAG